MEGQAQHYGTNVLSYFLAKLARLFWIIHYMMEKLYYIVGSTAINAATTP